MRRWIGTFCYCRKNLLPTRVVVANGWTSIIARTSTASNYYRSIIILPYLSGDGFIPRCVSLKPPSAGGHLRRLKAWRQRARAYFKMMMR